MNPKSNQSQCRYSTSFFNSFFIQNPMVHQTPDLAKSLKNLWFFNSFADSACYNLMWNLIKTLIHFDMKIDQNFIKNQSKNDTKTRPWSRLHFAAIFDRFWDHFRAQNRPPERFQSEKKVYLNQVIQGACNTPGILCQKPTACGIKLPWKSLSVYGLVNCNSCRQSQLPW